MDAGQENGVRAGLEEQAGKSESRDLISLAGRIREILRRPNSARRASGAEAGPVPTGWAAVDEVLGGGLARGALHEWFGIAEEDPGRRASAAWAPPLYLAIHLAWQMIEFVAATSAGRGAHSGRVLWIGPDIWPYPRALVRDFGVRSSDASRAPGDGAHALHEEVLELVRWPQDSSRPARHLLEHSLLVDARPVEKRLWAIDTALRCPSVVAVVADGSGFDMAATRRLQLAAEVGHGLALLLRPPREFKSLSAATTRWRVGRCLPVDGVARPRWSLGLMRSKGHSLFGSTLTP
ncbi:MAG: hypothetical protein ACI8QZ_001031 [Chlamydiales bacterium]|jgi:hypothetical protein